MNRNGATLIDTVTVVLIIGILTTIAMPSILGGSRDADIAATAQHLQTIALAAELFQNDQGFWPADTAGGVRPAPLEGYLRPDAFAEGCPLGGAYDWDRNRFGVAAAVKIVSPKPTTDEMLAIDQMIDDGNLATGFVVDANGFKLIVER